MGMVWMGLVLVREKNEPELCSESEMYSVGKKIGWDCSDVNGWPCLLPLLKNLRIWWRCIPLIPGLGGRGNQISVSPRPTTLHSEFEVN